MRLRSTVSTLRHQRVVRCRRIVRRRARLFCSRSRMMRQMPWWSSRSNARSSVTSSDVSFRAFLSVVSLTLCSTNATSSSSPLCSCATKHTHTVSTRSGYFPLDVFPPDTYTNTRTWQTDGRTETAWRHRPRLCIASRCKTVHILFNTVIASFSGAIAIVVQLQIQSVSSLRFVCWW